MKTPGFLLALLLCCGIGGGFVLGRWSAPRSSSSMKSGRADQKSAADYAKPLPPIPPIGTALRRVDLTRKPTIAQITGEIDRAGKVGVFSFNKKWEIMINAL